VGKLKWRLKGSFGPLALQKAPERAFLGPNLDVLQDSRAFKDIPCFKINKMAFKFCLSLVLFDQFCANQKIV